MAHVRNVGDSIAFYRKLGFETRNTFVPEGRTDPTWAWLETGEARLMLALASEPVIAEQQAVLFYLYCDGRDVVRDTAGRVTGIRISRRQPLQEFARL